MPENAWCAAIAGGSSSQWVVCRDSKQDGSAAAIADSCWQLVRVLTRSGVELEEQMDGGCAEKRLSVTKCHVWWAAADC
jgi:hypothetical protein